LQPYTSEEARFAPDIFPYIFCVLTFYLKERLHILIGGEVERNIIHKCENNELKVSSAMQSKLRKSHEESIWRMGCCSLPKSRLKAKASTTTMTTRKGDKA